jgi:hypothetical protein
VHDGVRRVVRGGDVNVRGSAAPLAPPAAAGAQASGQGDVRVIVGVLIAVFGVLIAVSGVVRVEGRGVGRAGCIRPAADTAPVPAATPAAAGGLLRVLGGGGSLGLSDVVRGECGVVSIDGGVPVG